MILEMRLDLLLEPHWVLVSRYSMSMDSGALRTENKVPTGKN